jgi:hypothetical protein
MGRVRDASYYQHIVMVFVKYMSEQGIQWQFLDGEVEHASGRSLGR